MNRNTELHFSELPTIDMQRSTFEIANSYKTTFNEGEIIPNYLMEILPGDTVVMDMASVERMQTPIFPVMDNAYADQYFFFVPTRLLWEHWREFNGENRTTFWEQDIEHVIPQIKAPNGGWQKGTLADYFGLPTNTENISVSALPFRAYALIWNEWFRNQNTNQPCLVNIDDATIDGSNGPNYITDVQKGGKPAKASRRHDYFSSALPQPQKGPEVLMPLGNYAPVICGATNITHESDYALRWVKRGTEEPAANGTIGIYSGYTVSGGAVPSGSETPTPANLYANLAEATGATINQLRMSFAIQRQYEKDARYGTRYRETIRGNFGVTTSDARMQIPEYIGGKRVPINMDQVVQTSATDENMTPQGNVAAYSVTRDADHLFTKSFEEHGYLIGLRVIRVDRSYQQGIDRMWSRKNRFDFYWPSLATISEQAILNKEIYATGTSADEEAFGYQEPWADYRYKNNKVTGELRSNYAQSLDAWHYADYYESQPILSSEWMLEGTENINRTIAVQDQLADQFLGDYYFKAKYTRVMPVYSVPGLIDHH